MLLRPPWSNKQKVRFLTALKSMPSRVEIFTGTNYEITPRHRETIGLLPFKTSVSCVSRSLDGILGYISNAVFDSVQRRPYSWLHIQTGIAQQSTGLLQTGQTNSSDCGVGKRGLLLMPLAPGVPGILNFQCPAEFHECSIPCN